MTFTDFINHYIGKKVDYDNYFGAQCVDLFRQYCKDVLNIPHTGSVEGAKDIFIKYEQLPLEKQYFDRVASFKFGDVVVWNSNPVNKYGHIAIFISYIEKDNCILVFEQDGFKQDGAKISARSSYNIIGGLRKK